MCVLDNRNEKILIKNINNYYLAQKQILPDSITNNIEFEHIDEVNSLKVNLNKFEKTTSVELVAKITDENMFVFNSPIDVNTRGYNPDTGFIARLSSTAIRLEYDSQPFEVEISAEQYSTTQDESIVYQNQDPNNYGKELTLMNSPLISETNGKTIVQRWLNYQQSHLLKVKLQYIATTQETSDIVQVILPNNREIIGEIVYQSLDVAGGMIANAEIMCSNKLD